MKNIILNNKVEMPVLGLGTFRAKGDEAVKTIVDAIDCGYRLIDTAKYYFNEEEVGEGIKVSQIDREKIFLTTKVWFKDFEDAYNSAGDSLKRLNVDYVDLLLIHWPFGNYYKAWRDLERLYKEGKARAIGVSNFNPDRLVDLIGFNEIVPSVNQVETNLLCQRIDDHIWFEKYGVAHQGYRPLYRKEIYAKYPLIKDLCEKYSKTPTQIVLNFFASQNISLIPKTVHKERMRENIDIFDFNLTNEEFKELRLLDLNEATCGYPEKPQKVLEALRL